MPDLTTDPKLMRSQQDKDTQETISDDETAEPRGRSDTDPASEAAREASKKGVADYPDEQMESIFHQNGRLASEGSASDTHFEEDDKTATRGLAQDGRSRLGK